jgi:hypothetical protein
MTVLPEAGSGRLSGLPWPDKFSNSFRLLAFNCLVIVAYLVYVTLCCSDPLVGRERDIGTTDRH